MLKHFNLFEVLFKDDKELSHSAVIKFLLEEDDFFYTNFLQCNKPINPTIKLEFKLNKSNRADILIIGEDKVIIVENKFKCLPYKAQLQDYSQNLSVRFPDKKIEKYLLYFHKSEDFDIPKDWEQITYFDLKNVLDKYVSRISNIDKKIFLQHYLDSLKSYTGKYLIIRNGEDLEPFFKGKEGNFGFWLNIIFHELKSKIRKGTGYETWVGNGNTYVPFINVHYPEWTYEKRDWVESVIQLNGQKLKYYTHLDKIEDKKERVERVKKEISQLKSSNFKVTSSGEFKKLTQKEFKTCFIYQENIIERIKAENKNVNFESLIWAIQDLIKRINSSTEKTAKSIDCLELN